MKDRNGKDLTGAEEFKNREQLCDNLEGLDGVGGRREFLEGGDICIPMAGSC